MTPHQKVELPIARHFIRNALKQGYQLAIFDGEEVAIPMTDKFDELNKGIASTDYDVLHVYSEGLHVGSVTFIWGNGCDVLSDHADNNIMEELTRPTMVYAERFQ